MKVKSFEKCWEKEIKRNVMLYPDERIVSFLARNFKDIESNSKKEAFDFGFGSGRHMKLLLDYNFNVSGTDLVEECKKVLNDNLGESEKLKEIYVGDFLDVDIPENQYDVLVNWGSIFLNELDKIEKIIKKSNEILKTGGKMIINFRTKEDWLYGKGEKIGNNTFILGKEAGSYEGMLYTFYDVTEAKALLEKNNFKVLNIEQIDYYKSKLSMKNSWTIFEVEKI